MPFEHPIKGACIAKSDKELFIRNVIVTTEKRNVEDFENQLLKPQEVETPAEGEGLPEEEAA